MLNVTKTYIPSRDLLDKYIKTIYETNVLTNFGELEQRLTSRLKDFLEVDNLLLTSNGTIAMQVLYKAFGLSGEVITTPFSFVATTSSLIWEGLEPVFSDIDSTSFNLDPNLIIDKITSQTSAILPVHVFGRPCELSELQLIADKYNLKLIYDAAHAFNVWTQNGENILTYGDASILSFHATKIFHTIEGGAIISKDAALIKECKKIINFGITGYDKIEDVGINGKMSEFSAAMGLSVLDDFMIIHQGRKRVVDLYNALIHPSLLPANITFASNNYSYYPILLQNEEVLLKLRAEMLTNHIMPRRYFYPSLNTLNYVNYTSCPVSEDISSRILCLPLYESLQDDDVKRIANIVNNYIYNWYT